MHNGRRDWLEFLPRGLNWSGWLRKLTINGYLYGYILVSGHKSSWYLIDGM